MSPKYLEALREQLTARLRLQDFTFRFVYRNQEGELQEAYYSASAPSNAEARTKASRAFLNDYPALRVLPTVNALDGKKIQKIV